jgi:SMC interacting uncharacterized protein involved in chromosome segregation
MTRKQANLISVMIRSQTTAVFHDARRQLLESCEEQKSDAAVPQPVGFDYKKEAEDSKDEIIARMQSANALLCEGLKRKTSEIKSLKEVIGSQDGKIASLKESVENRTKKIEALYNQIELLKKQIKEDKQHCEDKAAIDDGHRKHNNELVAANAEIYESLRHWGLEQSEPCSLVDNVKQVIQLCAERGKAHFEQKDKIERLNDQIDSQSKVIAELTEQRDQWDKLAAQRAGKMNQYSDMIDLMEKQCDRKDNEIKALKATCDIRQGFIDKGREVSDELRKQLAEKSAEIEELKKDRSASIIASNQILGALNQTSLRQYDGSLADNVVDAINHCVAQEKKIENLEQLAETRRLYANNEMAINRKKTVEIEELQKHIKRLEEWIANLDQVAAHSGQSDKREWFGPEIGWLHPGHVAYMGEAKP